MEQVHTIQTTSLLNNRLLTSNDLNIGSLNIQDSKELTKKALLKELAIQRNSLSKLNDHNLHGFLTPRDVQKALHLIQDNISNLIDLLLEKEELEF